MQRKKLSSRLFDLKLLHFNLNSSEFSLPSLKVATSLLVDWVLLNKSAISGWIEINFLNKTEKKFCVQSQNRTRSSPDFPAFWSRSLIVHVRTFERSCSDYTAFLDVSGL